MVGVDCYVHGEHSAMVPIETHRIRPPSRGGDPFGAAVPLCANAHGLVHALLDEIEAVAVTTPHGTVHQVVRMVDDNIWASFPGRVRLIAYRSWQSYGAAFIGNSFHRQHDLWDTAGRPREANVPAYGQLSRMRNTPRRLRWEISRL
jgi:hypothetical protein